VIGDNTILGDQSNPDISVPHNDHDRKAGLHHSQNSNGASAGQWSKAMR
jgi:hypothetical protein